MMLFTLLYAAQILVAQPADLVAQPAYIERVWRTPPELLATVSAIAESTESVSICLLYTSPSPRDRTRSRMPSSA